MYLNVQLFCAVLVDFTDPVRGVATETNATQTTDTNTTYLPLHSISH
jgi:hypothetical protein